MKYHDGAVRWPRPGPDPARCTRHRPRCERRGGVVPTEPFDVVCLSLEPWDDVWRRNQHLAAQLLRLRPSLRLLFAAVPVDVAWSLRQGRWPARSALQPVGGTGRLWTMAPR